MDGFNFCLGVKLAGAGLGITLLIIAVGVLWILGGRRK